MIQYNSAAINEMLGDLNRYGSTMKAQIDELHGAADAFRASLSGDQAIDNFNAAHKSLSIELEDTLVKLDKLGIQVENALHRAIEADGKVGDGFAGIV